MAAMAKWRGTFSAASAAEDARHWHCAVDVTFRAPPLLWAWCLVAV
jgi:hypothetical protein